MAMAPKTPKVPSNSTKGSAFSQAVRALPKGARGQAVSAMAKAKVKTPEVMPPVTKAPDVDGKILRTMPIAESHLKAIKKAYGIK